MLEQEQITKNAEMVMKLIENHIVSDRKDKISKMLEKIGTQFYTAPASKNINEHEAYTGGLVEHSLKVLKNLIEICNIWYKNCPVETRVIVGLFHDFDKSCTTDGTDWYIPNESQWHREKLGKMYELNPIIRDGLTHAQRSVRLLSYFNINLTDEEYLAILTHDGLYVDENISFKTRMNKLGLLLHWADSKSVFFKEEL